MAVEYERVLTYWEVGGLVIGYLDGIDVERGAQVMKNLAVDVDIRERLLYEMVELRKAFPFLPSEAKISWSHFRRLISVKDERARYGFLDAAVKGKWSVSELSERIRTGTLPGTADSASPSGETRLRIRAKRGEPYVYRVVERYGVKMLDVGFRGLYRLGQEEGFEVGDLVRSVRVDEKDLDLGGGDGEDQGWGRYGEARDREVAPTAELPFRLVAADDLHRRLYAYKIRVKEIIDGDTLWATIDFGFRMMTEHKLRLRGIDAPERNGIKGLDAMRWLEKRLGEAPMIVVTTTMVDLYDRDLADVFVSSRAETDVRRVAKAGVFVNREMVEKGLARVWNG